MRYDESIELFTTGSWKIVLLIELSSVVLLIQLQEEVIKQLLYPKNGTAQEQLLAFLFAL